MSDPVQRFFGRDAGQGIALFDLLDRRYDVVTANPPYMGSKSMGPVLKAYCGAHYSAGKRDLYSVFIERCRQLARWDGYVAMVTQQSWIFLRSFAELRESRSFGRRLSKSLAHLGGSASPKLSGEVVTSRCFAFVRLSQVKTTSSALFA